MGIFELGMRTGGRQRISKLAHRIAQKSFGPLLGRIEGISPGMSEPEVRGYIRARASAIVNRAVDSAVERDRRLRASDRQRLIAMVTDLLVDAAAGEHGFSRRRAAA